MKIRLFLLLLCCLAATAVMGDDLYKWVDAQGNVHYSDKPQPGAQKLKLPQATTYTAPVSGDVPAQAPETPAQNPAAAASFVIVSPQQDETLWNTQNVTVSLAVDPALQSGDTVTITLDGTTKGPLEGLSAEFTDLDRGAHTISAVLQRADGGSMTAKPVTFYIQRATQH